MIGICTDSGAQLPAELIARYDIEIVPITVTVDGVSYLEHVDLDADAFYAHFSGGARPAVATAAPSPARFEAAYRSLAARGATEILSIHVGSELSGAVNAAHVARLSSPVPVRLLDTGSASFVVGAAAWAASESRDRGATMDQAADVGETVARRAGNIFVVGALDLARAGGRLVGDAVTGAAIPVLRLDEGKMSVIGEARSVAEAADVMAHAVLTAGDGLRVGIGTSDPSSAPLADALTDRVARSPSVHEVVQYRVGPSVGAHTGPGTAGAVFYTRP